MPGMNIIQHFDRGAMAYRSIAEKATDLLGLSWHTGSMLLANESFLVSSRIYPGYPLDFWSDARFYYLVEGRIYGRSQSQVRSLLTDMAEAILLRGVPENRLGRELFDLDGDFVLWMAEKATGRSVLLNDVFARLPVYFFKEPAGVMISRDVRFITEAQDTISLNPLGLAQLLAFGHCLQGITPWRNINMLQPGSMLLISPHNGQTQLKTLYTFNFSEKKNRGVRIGGNAEQLAQLLTRSCAARSQEGRASVVSLSGGLDSRAVACGLAAGNRPFFSATMVRPGQQQSREVQVAKTIASILESPWHPIELSEATFEDALELLQLRNGQNSLEMAFILQFFRGLRASFGPELIYFTGDGGDRMLPVIEVPRPIFGLKDLVDYIAGANFANNYQLKMEHAAALVRIPLEELWSSLAENVVQYPERSWRDKCLHYKIYGRAIQVYNQAEDRNRAYFWSASPFYSNEFFHYAMNCPVGQKARYELYHRVLRLLSPRAANTEYVDMGSPLGSARLELNYYKMRLKRLDPGRLRKLKHLFVTEKGFAPHSKPIALIKRQLQACPEIKDCLDPSMIQRILRERAEYGKQNMLKLVTVTSTIEATLRRRSCLDECSQELFGWS